MATYEVELRLGRALCQNSTGNLCAYKLEEVVVCRRILAFRNGEFFRSLIH